MSTAQKMDFFEWAGLFELYQEVLAKLFSIAKRRD